MVDGSGIWSAPAPLAAPRHRRQPGNTWGQECRWLWESAAVQGLVQCDCRLLCSMATASPASASMHSVKATASPCTHGLFKTKQVHPPYRGRWAIQKPRNGFQNNRGENCTPGANTSVVYLTPNWKEHSGYFIPLFYPLLHVTCPLKEI